MKKAILITAAIALCTFSYGQWTDEGGWLTTDDNVGISGKRVIEFGKGLEKGTNAGMIGYQTFSGALDIVGAGTSGTDRKVRIYAEGGTAFNGPISGPSNLLLISGHAAINGKGYLEFGRGIAGKNVHAGKIGYQTFSGALDIVGAGTSGTDRKVRIYAEGGLTLTGYMNGFGVGGKQVIEFGNGLTKETHAGRIGYQTYSAGLDIVGAGATRAERKVTIFAEGGLDVKGKVHATTYTAVTPPWSDFVFEDSYNLRSLESVESYIKEHKHLPDVPGETELNETGLNLPEMDATLLQKIEELTLYVIEQNKLLKAQQQEIAAQQQQLKAQQQELADLKKKVAE
jgi:hypothetical protein